MAVPAEKMCHSCAVMRVTCSSVTTAASIFASTSYLQVRSTTYNKLCSTT